MFVVPAAEFDQLLTILSVHALNPLLTRVLQTFVFIFATVCVHFCSAKAAKIAALVSASEASCSVESRC